MVVLSHALWQTRFGADPTVVGRALVLNDAAVTVIGIMLPRFAYPQFNLAGDLWMPLSIDAAALETDRRTSYGVVSVARLRPTVSLDQAQAEMDTIYQRLEAAYPNTNTGVGLRVTPMQQMLADQLFPPLMLLMAVVAVVLLIVCANVASLLLARASARAREMAIRGALGAGRTRLFRQLLTEALLLAGLGGGLGVLLSVWGLGAVRAAMPEFVASAIPPAVREIGIDLRVLAFSGGVSLLATLLFGLAPALMLSKPAAGGQRANRSSGDGGGGRHRLLSLLVVGEVALSAILLVGAGLTTRSLWNVLQVDPGFDSRGLIVLDLALPTSKYPDVTRRAMFLSQLLDRLHALPGVDTAGVVNTLPLSSNSSSTPVSVDGQPPAAPGETARTDYRVVSQGYFDTMRIPRLRGRGFTTRDQDTATPVVVVNQTFAERFLAGGGPVGQRVRLGDADGPWREIVGVVGNVKHTGLTLQANPETYVPLHQSAPELMALVVRASGPTAGLAAAIESEMRALDPDQPADGVYLMDQVVDTAMLVQRAAATFTAAFGVLALVLATMGLYGVIAYVAAQRVPQLAIRMALGAQPGDVLRLVLRQGVVLALVGIGIGLATAFAMTRLLSSLLYGLAPTDPATFAVVAVGLVTLTLVACFLPARRASRIDPMRVLRLE